mmetsp:Transcript_19999/g.28461  ORF Transcript_19999/g.28461 Transcript_19999/m.28461 type:complete len:313 (+) Transcript_19999:49-987(+)
MMIPSALTTLILASLLQTNSCFSSLSRVLTRADVTMMSAVPIASTEDTSTKLPSLLKCDRYVATNRFAVRKGKEAKFEQRWTTRKSRLSNLEGFKYFQLMRRVSLDGGIADDESLGNYVSFTTWAEKKHFSSWRKGEAFKEAHGGTSIGAFVSTLVSSALVLQGPPRPAFYDGILTLSSVPESVPDTQGGWRKVDANGKDLLPAECFVACDQFCIPEESKVAFENLWSKKKECDGFVAFIMLRRDGSQKGHGIVPINESEPTYITTTIWRDRATFIAWQKNQSISDLPTQFFKPPSPVFYEGVLVISHPEGL